MKKIIQFCYLLILLYCIFLPQKINASISNKSVTLIENTYSTNSLIVTMNSSNSSTRKAYGLSDFTDVDPDIVIDNEKFNKDFSQTQDTKSNTSLIKSSSKNKQQSLTLKWNKNFSKDEMTNLINTLQKRDDIYSVQPNYLYKVQSMIPNDTLFMQQNNQETADILKAWDYTTGSHFIKVGVIDSGIDGTHPDLIQNLDNNLHKDFTSYEGNPLEDNYGHGTNVAGIIGARGNNENGISGICWDVSLVSLKVYEPDDSSADAYVESYLLKLAVDYADANNIHILNFSWQLINSSNQPINDSVVYSALQNYDGIFVCSAGNCLGGVTDPNFKDTSNDNDNHEVFPSCYSKQLSNVISVGGLNYSGKRSEYSRYGEESVSLYASYYGYTTGIEPDRYMEFTGTSCSAPIVAGALALIYSFNTNMSLDYAKNLLINNCDEITIHIYELVNGIPTPKPNHLGKKLNIYESIKNAMESSFEYLTVHNIINNSYNDFDESCTLSNNSFNFSNKKFYKLNVIDSATYQFRIDDSLCSQITIYDNNLNKLDVYNCNSIGQVRIFEPLAAGVYYVKVESNYSGLDNVSLTIHREFDTYLSYNSLNHYLKTNFEDYNVRYIHEGDTGLYYVTFMIYNSVNEILSDCPDNMLEIYSNDERSILIGSTTYDSLVMTINLEHGATYYFDIETNISDLYSFDILISNGEE